MFEDNDILLMKRALFLAKKGVGLTGINPLVGAVLVKDGRVMGEGYHVKANLDHAEVVALNGLSYSQTKGSTLYVTLEPCCHKDKETAPCVDKLIEAGIKKIVIGLKDPNRKVCGRGIKILKNAGIHVVAGVLEDESAAMNEFYIHSIKNHIPFVAIKHAVSIDGKIAAKDGSSKWISNPEARKIAHRLRSIYDAVLTSGVTVQKDNPMLNVRLVKGRNPKRVIVDWGFSTNVNSKVYRDNNVIVVTSLKADKKREEQFARKGIKVRRYERSQGLRPVLRDLYLDGIGSVIVESGGRFAASLLNDRLVNKFIYFMAPIFLGSDGISTMGKLNIKTLNDAIMAKSISMKKLGNNAVIEVYM